MLLIMALLWNFKKILKAHIKNFAIAGGVARNSFISFQHFCKEQKIAFFSLKHTLLALNECWIFRIYYYFFGDYGLSIKVESYYQFLEKKM